MKQKLIKIIVAAAALFTAGIFAGAQEAAEIVNPRRETLNETITATAVTTPRNRLEVRPPVGGRLEAMLVKEGEQVKTGQPLATMSSTERATLMDAARGKGEAEEKYWQEVYKPIQLVAPMEAMVIVATLQPGQVVATTDPIVVLSDQLIVRAQVDETDIGKVKLGQDATVTLDAFPQSPIAATVEHIYFESVVQSNVTVYKVDLKVAQVPDFFRSGMNAQVAFNIARKENALVLPADVVDFSTGRATVIVMNDKNKEEVRPVETGLVTSLQVEIVSGLAPDSKVVRKQRKLDLKKASSGTNPFMPQFGKPRK